MMSAGTAKSGTGRAMAGASDAGTDRMSARTPDALADRATVGMAKSGSGSGACCG